MAVLADSTSESSRPRNVGPLSAVMNGARVNHEVP